MESGPCFAPSQYPQSPSPLNHLVNVGSSSASQRRATGSARVTPAALHHDSSAGQPPPNCADIISFVFSADPIELQSKSGPTLNKQKKLHKIITQNANSTPERRPFIIFIDKSGGSRRGRQAKELTCILSPNTAENNDGWETCFVLKHTALNRC